MLPAPPGRPADTTAPTPPSSVREFLREDRLRDVTLNRASGPARYPGVDGVDGEEEPDTYSKLESQRDSGSERSFRSQRSFDVVPLSTTFRTRSGGPPKSSNGSDSHRSNGSHGHSYSSSYAHSRSSHESGTRGGLSVRSSVSDTTSDGSESAGSAGSRGGAKGRPATVGQAESQGRAGPGREAVEQIRSLGGQSDDESF